MSDSHWNRLAERLEQEDLAGNRVTFWLRDDDAIEVTAALEQLLTLTRAWRVPVTLAVIPGLTGSGLSQYLAEQEHAVPVVHGWSHTNHAQDGQKKAELGSHRPVAELLSDLKSGLDLLSKLHGNRLMPMLVPPWNRLSPELLPLLGSIGYSALSGFGLDTPECSVPVINTHLDIIEWRGSRGGRDPAVLVEELLGHFASGRPIGVLTHHLVHDETAWTFLESLFAATRDRWLTPQQALALSQAD